MKRSPAAFNKQRAFSAQRFGKQKARRAFHVQSGGMELHELDIADLRAGAPRHGDAVAGRHIGIGGIAINTRPNPPVASNTARA